jgi:hypothetical protein
MATVLNSPYPQFVFVFAAVRRCERQQHIHMLRTVAADERAARLLLAHDYVLSFAARLPRFPEAWSASSWECLNDRIIFISVHRFQT